MIKILLICSAGISTSRVVERMRDHAKTLNVKVKIKSIGDANKAESIPRASIILLGPQIRYTIDEVKKVSGTTPVVVMDSQNFGLLRGDLILEAALNHLNIAV